MAPGLVLQVLPGGMVPGLCHTRNHGHGVRRLGEARGRGSARFPSGEGFGKVSERHTEGVPATGVLCVSGASFAQEVTTAPWW